MDWQEMGALEIVVAKMYAAKEDGHLATMVPLAPPNVSISTVNISFSILGNVTMIEVISN